MKDAHRVRRILLLGDADGTLPAICRANDRLFGLKRALEREGIWAHLYPHRLQAKAVRPLVDLCRADAVFELDRARGELPELPREVRHVAWWHSPDPGERHLRTDSDLNYFHPYVGNQGRTPSSRHAAELLPGVDDAFQPPDPTSPPRVDFSFAGHLAPPLGDWTELAGARSFPAAGTQVPLADVVSRFRGTYALGRSPARPEVERLLTEAVRASLGLEVESLELPPETWHLFAHSLPRYETRRRLLDTVLSRWQSLTIVGHGGWASHPQYASHYLGFLAHPADLRLFYATTRINLHDGVAVAHHRILDSMASGGFVLALEPSGRPEFEPGVHYGAYTRENLLDVAQRYLADQPTRQRIGRDAARVVLDRHTWSHRAKRILEDLNRL